MFSGASWLALLSTVPLPAQAAKPKKEPPAQPAAVSVVPKTQSLGTVGAWSAYASGDKVQPAGLGFLVVWTAPELWVAWVGLFVLGFGMGAHYPLSISRAVALSDGQPDVAAARASIGAGLAVGIAPFVLGWLADSFGTHTAFLLVPALLGAAAAILLTTASLVPHDPTAKPTTDVGSDPG